jgi:hypothetical protein
MSIKSVVEPNEWEISRIYEPLDNIYKWSCIIISRSLHMCVTLHDISVDNEELDQFIEWMNDRKGYDGLNIKTSDVFGKAQDSLIELLFCDDYTRISTGGVTFNMPIDIGIKLINHIDKYFRTDNIKNTVTPSLTNN